MAKAALAVERILRQGDEQTLPAVDAERIARVARRHRLAASDLLEAAADIADVSRKPTLPLARAVWRFLGDPGAAVLNEAARLLSE